MSVILVSETTIVGSLHSKKEHLPISETGEIGESDVFSLVHFCAQPVLEKKTGGGGGVSAYKKRSYKWAGVESNRRHTDFQSVALPTELPALSTFTLHSNGQDGKNI